MFEGWSGAMQTHLERVLLFTTGLAIVVAAMYYLYTALDWIGVATAAFLVLGMGTMQIAAHHTVKHEENEGVGSGA